MARSRRMVVPSAPLKPMSREELVAAREQMYALIETNLRTWLLNVTEASIASIRSYDAQLAALLAPAGDSASPAPANENGR